MMELVPLPPDRLIRCLAKRPGDNEPTLRVLFAETAATCATGAETHKLGPLAAMAFGRALTGGVLLAGLAKSERNVNVQFAGEGPLKSIFVDADPAGLVRGYVGRNGVLVPAEGSRPSVAVGLSDRGFLNVMKADPNGQYSRGTVALKSGEIDEDIQEYLSTSEQVESALALEVVLYPSGGVAWACGVLIQALPSQGKLSLEALRADLAAPRLHKVVDDKRTDWVTGLSQALGLELQVLGEEPIKYQCSCSDQRVMAALMATGVDELTDMANEGMAEVVCDFCGKIYDIDREQLSKLRDLTVSAALSHKDPNDNDDN